MLLYEDKKNSISLSLRTGLSFLPHLHSHIEAGYLLSGSTSVTVDGREYSLSAGDAFVIFPNRVHSYEDGGGNPCCWLLMCSPDDVSPFAETFKRFLPDSPVVTGADGRALGALFELAEGRVPAAEEGLPLGTECLRAYASALTAELLPRLSGLRPLPPSDPDAMRRILLYCDLHYRDELSLDLLSEELGYSKYYISHVFSDHVKIGFARYVRALRVNAAKRLIRNGGMSMTDVACESGFSSIRTFNRQFMQETGISPSRYALLRRRK